ncbi:MAG: YbaK/EbsC family protein [Firmicutes bacterium]|nr:YbaK/EbsC family protein [Bacillota bacterium]
MSIERVKEYLSQFGADSRVREFDVSSATVQLAAAALGCEDGRIAKSLTFNVDGRPVMIVAAGDVKVNNSKYKAEFGTKAKMLTADEVAELVGHKVGGVCPFAVNDGVEVYLDVSLKQYSTVFPACGSSNSAIELTIPEMEKFANCKKWVDVCKPNGAEQ